MHEKTCIILQEVVQIVKSCPPAASPWAEKEALCPEDLLLGRAGNGIPACFKMGLQLIKKFPVVQEAKEEFWDRWVWEVLPSLLKQKKNGTSTRY
jgi:hypothetical protein